MSHLQTSNLPFKQRVEQQVNNEIMRKAVVKPSAQTVKKWLMS